MGAIGQHLATAFVGLAATAGMWLSGTAAFAFGFVPPPDNEAPRQNSAGGAARGPACSSSAGRAQGSRPAAVLPASNYGKTLLSHPTLMVYVPPIGADGLLLVLKDDSDNTLYSQNIEIAPSEGILAITLPAVAPPLEIGQSYQWLVALKCDGILYPHSPIAAGWLQRARAPLALSAILQSGSAAERAAALGNAGIWYDYAAALAALPRAQLAAGPADSLGLEAWQTFLTSAGLAHFATVPIVQL